MSVGSLRNRLQIFRDILHVLLHVIRIRAECAQFQPVQNRPSQFTVYVHVSVLLTILYLKASQRVLDLVRVGILIPFAILILMRREGWVVSSGRIESFLIIVRIIHLLQGTEHTELDFQLIVEHILGSVQFSRIILHTAILDNTLLIDHAYRSTIIRIVVTRAERDVMVLRITQLLDLVEEIRITSHIQRSHA